MKRWDYEPEVWVQLLAEYGFVEARATVLEAPPGRRRVGTLIVSARAAGTQNPLAHNASCILGLTDDINRYRAARPGVDFGNDVLNLRGFKKGPRGGRDVGA